MQQPLETTVKAYNNTKDYSKDLEKMNKAGWSVQSVIDHQNERSLAGKLFVPGGMFTKGKSQIVVTYQRPLSAKPEMPEGLSPADQHRWFKQQGMSFGEQIQYYKEHPNRK